VLVRDVCVTIDVEWAHPDVLADVRALLDERSIAATFFCTHAGIDLPNHERALHPNFRRTGNSALEGAPADLLANDQAFYRHIMSTASAWYPDAVGVRAHSLIADSALLPIYRDFGLRYDSSYMLPLTPGLAPVARACGVVELPIYYMDHWDLSEKATGFTLDRLALSASGLKILDFHPNLIAINAASSADYEACRPHYHDPEWLRAHRRPGRGVRTLFLEVLDALAGRGRAARLGDVDADWRTARATA
jgi:hypothetical protein